MVHPSHSPAVLAIGNVDSVPLNAGRPARYAPVIVHSRDQEESERARGYLNPGEAPQVKTHHAEYPKILRHPQYAPAIPPTQRSIVVGNEVKIIDAPGRPERNPDVTVENADQEAYWMRQGWAPAGHWDAEAFERAHSITVEDYDPQEYPKWVDSGEMDEAGKPIMRLVQDPNAMPAEVLAQQAHEYPKYVGGQIVQSAAEEAVLANAENPVLGGVEGNAVNTSLRPYVTPAPPQPVFDPSTLKAEIVAELMPQIRAAISEALAPQIVPTGTPPKPKRTLSEEHKAKLVVGREEARRRREAGE